MSQEQRHEASSAENLLDDEQTDNSYINPGVSVETISIPSSPPPSYQRVLEETRLAENKRTTLGKVKCASFEESSPSRSSLTRRSHTISSHEEDVSSSDDDDGSSSAFEKLNSIGDEDHQDEEYHQEPSTSFDASSRQLDEDSVAELDDELQQLRRPSSHNQNNEIILANKTSKEMYAALAKELGLSCKMSDQCRCADCQGGYLHCDPEGDSATDGGLGAGTPMFVSEIFGHGTAPACTIL